MNHTGRCPTLAALAVALAVWFTLNSLGQGADAVLQASPGATPEVAIQAVAPAVAAPLPPAAADPLLAPPTSGADPLGDLSSDGDFRSAAQRLSFGGYGEIHANSVEGPGRDEVDLHRLVLSAQYDFTSWLRFVSELELEHAFVTTGAGGELAFEQAYV